MHSPGLMAGMLPALQRLCSSHIERCAARGVEVAIVSARRTVAEQMNLFQKGRTLVNGIWVKTGRVVTNALPEKAPHCPHVDENGNIGCAAYDLAIVINKQLVFNETLTLPDGPTYTAPHPSFREVVGPEGEGLGLVWGHRFHSIDDLGHFELRDWRSMPLGVGDSRDHRKGLRD